MTTSNKQREPVKLLVDECLGKPMMEDVAGALSRHDPPPVFAHLQDFFVKGTCDSVWIPKIAKDGWMILTADRGKSSGVKLPAICVTYGVTHVLMGAALMRAKQGEKAKAIVAIWEDLQKCYDAPKGTRFSLRLGKNRKPLIVRVG